MAEYEASIITSGQPCSLPVAFVAEFVGSTLYMYCGMMPYLLHVVSTGRIRSPCPPPPQSNPHRHARLLCRVHSLPLMLMLALTGISMRISLHHADSMPLAVGLIVAGFLVATEPFTGGCMNPMRSLPPCIYENDWKDHWVFHLAPYGGMMTGAIMYRAIFDKDFKYSLYNVK
ncbi:hypothetical protein NQ317_012929, partial [Molorchus minor]